MIIQRYLKKIFLLLMCNATFAFGSNIPDYLLAYSIVMGSVVAHEAGHAYAIKQLYNEDCELNVGAYQKDTDTLLKVGNVNFKFPMLPMGYVLYYSHGKNHLSDIAIGVSGPLAGSLSCLASYALLKLIFPKDYDFACAKRASGSVMIGHLFNFIPHPGFDGDHIWQSFKKWRQECQMMEEAKQKRGARLKRKK